jgi:hypothetical protein
LPNPVQDGPEQATRDDRWRGDVRPERMEKDEMLVGMLR